MKSIITIIALLLLNRSYAQWTKINSIPTQEIVALSSMNDTIYAASGTNLIYKSTDNGNSWNAIPISSQPIDIYTLKIIDNKIHIGTLNNGIFTSENFGTVWTNHNNTLQAISGFAKFNNKIYASTVGNGVYRYEDTNNTWVSFNNELPSNLAYNVETITTTSNKLLIGAGGNGIFYHYDFSNNQWDFGYYYGSIMAGLIIQKIINHSDILYAVNGNRIISSNDNGLNWTDDKTGSNNGIDRNIFVGTTNLYTLTNLIGGGTWIQKRNKNAAIGTSWNTDEELLPTGYSFDILEFKNKLFLAKANGLYVKDIALGVDEPNNILNQVKIFPNPSSKAGKINIISPVKINKIQMCNAIGQFIYKAEPLVNNFMVESVFPAKGIYFITLYFDNITLTKKLIIE